MTRLIRLQEAGRLRSVPLSTEEARWIHSSQIAEVSPGAGLGTFDLRVGHLVGTVAFRDLRLTVVPKLPIARVMWMLAVGGTAPGWREDNAELNTTDVVEAVAELLLREVREILRRGLISGYHQVERTDVVLRGRLRIGEQFARHYGMLHPLAIEYQEHDRDIPENQILLSALLALVNALRATGSDRAPFLASVLPAFFGVTPVVSGGALPAVASNRLNEHYADGLALSTLILDGVGLAESVGTQAGRGLLFPMWSVFERFVARTLDRQSHPGSVIAQHRTSLVVDMSSEFTIRPDLVIAEGGRRRLVVDTKYKTAEPSIGDLYQMCAYAGVLEVGDVMLLYAESTEPRTLTVSGTGVRVHIRGIDLACGREEVVSSVVGAVDSVLGHMNPSQLDL